MSAQTPAAPDVPPDLALTTLLGKQTDALGRTCTPAQVASSGELRFVACGAAGVWVVRIRDAQASLLEIRDVGGSADGLFTAEDKLWVRVSSVRALPLEQRAGAAQLPAPQPPAAPPQPPAALPQPPAAAPQPTAAPARPAPRRFAPLARKPELPARGKVIAQEDALVLVEMPEGALLSINEHIAFSTLEPNGDGERERHVLAIGRVVSRSGRRAKVLVGTNEHVTTDASAQTTYAETTSRLVAPPRASGLWEMSFLARPFLVLDDLGVGAVLDAQVGYRMDAPVHFAAALTPVAFGTARAGAVGAYAGLISAAFDTQLFEAGLGLGFQSVNDPDFGLEPGSGTLVAQHLRIGARDGAFLQLQSHVALFHRSFKFSSLRVTGQIPLGGRAWLHAAGGGGTIGMATGELGVRLLVAGNGGSGSAFVTVLVGWAAVFDGCNQLAIDSTCRERDYQGPMLGAGAEFRR